MYDNYHYPAGADNEQAPWYETDVPEKGFDVTCSQTLSRTASVLTNNYTPGESGVDYETDDEGHPYAVPWQDPDDTSDTNWSKEYEENGYHTPLQLIQMLKDYLQKDLEEWQKKETETPHSGPAFHVRRLQHLIEECDGFDEDEIEFSL